MKFSIQLLAIALAITACNNEVPEGLWVYSKDGPWSTSKIESLQISDSIVTARDRNGVGYEAELLDDLSFIVIEDTFRMETSDNELWLYPLAIKFDQTDLINKINLVSFAGFHRLYEQKVGKCLSKFGVKSIGGTLTFNLDDRLLGIDSLLLILKSRMESRDEYSCLYNLVLVDRNVVMGQLDKFFQVLRRNGIYSVKIASASSYWSRNPKCLALHLSPWNLQVDSNSIFVGGMEFYRQEEYHFQQSKDSPSSNPSDIEILVFDSTDLAEDLLVRYSENVSDIYLRRDSVALNNYGKDNIEWAAAIGQISEEDEKEIIQSVRKEVPYRLFWMDRSYVGELEEALLKNRNEE